MDGGNVILFGRWKNQTVGLHNYIIIPKEMRNISLRGQALDFRPFLEIGYIVSDLNSTRPPLLADDFYYLNYQLFELLTSDLAISVDIQCLHHIVYFGK